MDTTTNSSAARLFERFKQEGIVPHMEQKMHAELRSGRAHTLPATPAPRPFLLVDPRPLYGHTDMAVLQGVGPATPAPHMSFATIDELLERDKKREEDGFPRKVRIGRLIRPGKSEKNTVVVVPTTVEEKFIHDKVPRPGDETEAGGAGRGDEIGRAHV